MTAAWNALRSAVGNERFVRIVTALLFFAPLLNIPRVYMPGQGRLFILAADLVLFALLLASLLVHPPSRSSLGFILAVLICLGLANILNPNVPSVLTGLEGFRKSYYMMIAVYVGYTWCSPRYIRMLLAGTLCSGVVLGAYAIKQFIHWSGFDAAFVASQSSDQYTFLFKGVYRPSGLLSSPFGLAMLALVCVVAAYMLFWRQGGRSRVYYLLLLCFFVLVVYITKTRTNYIALAALLCYLHWHRKWMPVLIFAGLCVMIFGGAVGFKYTFASLFTDNRFLNRAHSLTGFANAFEKSRLGWFFGFGTGSAGDTLKSRFADGTFAITSHNLVLKFLFEVGPILALLYGVLLSVAFRLYLKLRPYLEQKRLFLGLVIIVCVNGLVGSAIEAWPVNIYIGLLAGAALAWPELGALRLGESPSRPPEPSLALGRVGTVLPADQTADATA